ncbi:hypothetical protein TNCV_3583701 [Trichonephila clavipes]|nr:hypothetical protein TNCV_3583701 [Trichonephila clavipes]
MVRSGYLPFRTNASTQPITPKRLSSRDVGTSSYRYHTATYSPASASVNMRMNDIIFVVSIPGRVILRLYADRNEYTVLFSSSCIRVVRYLKRAGRLSRMNEDRCCKKIFLAKPMGSRPRGRPPLRWIDCDEKDLKILKVKNWKKVAKSRDAWKRLLEEARAHPVLSSH